MPEPLCYWATSKLYQWRDAGSVESQQTVGKIIVTEIALSLLAVIAIVEAVAYGILSFLSLPLYLLTKRPFKFFASLSLTSTTTAVLIVCSLFLNLTQSRRLPPFFDESDHEFNSAEDQQQDTTPPRYYSEDGRVEVSLKDVKENPEIHLTLLTELLSKQDVHEVMRNWHWWPGGLRVIFSGQPGIGGGPTRQYISCLFKYLITQNEKWFVKDNAGFYAPKLPKECFDVETISLYRDMGRIMGLCLQSTPFVMGSYFNLSVFEIILTFIHHVPPHVEDELYTLCIPNEEILLKMIPVIKPTLGFLEKAQWDKEDINKALDTAVAMELVEEEELIGKSTPELVLLLRESLHKDYLETLSNSAAIETIRACYAIAQGITQQQQIYPRVDPQIFKSLNPQDICNKIQGSLDRKEIADRIRISGNPYPQLSRKVGWLKEWVLSEATNKHDLENFLLSATGSLAMPDEGVIDIGEEMENTNCPIRMSACSRSLYISINQFDDLMIDDSMVDDSTVDDPEVESTMVNDPAVVSFEQKRNYIKKKNRFIRNLEAVISGTDFNRA